MAAYETVAFALRSKLLSSSGVTDITSKIYPFTAPQLPSPPFLLYHTPRDVPIDDIGGCAGLFRAFVQFDAYALGPESAWELGEQVRLSLQGYTGTDLGVSIRGVGLEGQFDMFEPEIEEFRVLTTFKVWYDRINPS